MIPSAETLIEAHRFVARGLSVRAPAVRDLVHDAIVQARELAAVPEDEPAALFFALARRPGAFPGMRSVTPRILAQVQAERVGLRISANVTDFVALVVPIERQELSWEELRAWFTARIEPMPRP